MTPKQQNHQQDTVMTLNSWSIEDIQTFRSKPNIPHDVTEQMLDDYIHALKHLFNTKHLKLATSISPLSVVTGSIVNILSPKPTK